MKPFLPYLFYLWANFALAAEEAAHTGMSDAFWQALFTFLAAAMSTGVLYLAQRATKNAVVQVGTVNAAASRSAEASAEQAARAAVTVGEKLEVTDQRTSEKLDTVVQTQREQGKTLNDVHTLTNSAMGAQLLLVKTLSEDKARSDPTPENVEAARLAKEQYEKHVAGQKIVDAGKKVDGGSSTPPAPLTQASIKRTIGEAVGEVGADVKVIRQDVKDIKDRE